MQVHAEQKHWVSCSVVVNESAVWFGPKELQSARFRAFQTWAEETIWCIIFSFITAYEVQIYVAALPLKALCLCAFTPLDFIEILT